MKRLFVLATLGLILAVFFGCNKSDHGVESASSILGNPAPSSLERILKFIPDIPESRLSLNVYDIAKMRSELGISAPFGDQADPELVLEYKISLMTRAYEAIGAQLTSNLGSGSGETWLSGFVRISADADGTTYDSLGFDSRNVDLIASFGDEPWFREVLLGSYSSDITERKLAACVDCEPYDLVDYTGGTYYAWGADFKQSLSKRFAKPAFDQLGRGGRIFVGDGWATRTLSNEHMEQILNPATANLADDPDYVLAAQVLSKYGAATASFSTASVTVKSYIKRMQDAWDNGLPRVVSNDELEQQFSGIHLLLPYKITAIGKAFPETEGERSSTYAVLIHPSEQDATENAERLVQRIEEDPYLFGINLPGDGMSDEDRPATWGDFFTEYDVWTEGSALILRTTTERAWQILRWVAEDPTFIHSLFIAE